MKSREKDAPTMTLPEPTRRTFSLAALAALAAGAVRMRPARAQSADLWPGLASDVFKGREVRNGDGLLALDMPARAEDAALVPLTVRLTPPPSERRAVKAVTIIIDQNPAPVAASFELGPTGGVTAIATRVRVDSYTDVHAVAELTDGGLYAVQTYVKAAGGCSAPALKNPDEADAGIGQMRFKLFAQPALSVDPARREAGLMVRHPNHSGLQMDQITHLYVPAFFVRELRIWHGYDLVLAMAGGISISQDPNIRFTYLPSAARTFRAEAIDTEAHVFRGEWRTDGSQM
jgi:sulfur-oxidizing protein SoxY